MEIYIPDQVTSTQRMMVVFEAPHGTTGWWQTPTEKFLFAMLARKGFVVQELAVASVFPDASVGYDGLFNISPEDFRVQGRLLELAAAVKSFRPNLILLCGRLAYQAAGGQGSLDDYRGSLFAGTAAWCHGVKCLGVLSPTRCIRNYADTPILLFDLKRAASQSEFPELNLPDRQLLTSLPVQDILQRLSNIIASRQPVSVDIEGYLPVMTKISLSISPSESFLIPFVAADGQSYWSVQDEVEIWKLLSQVLSTTTIPKVLQNYLYDSFVLSYSYHCPILGLQDDTMLKHSELYSELPKNLGFQTSLYTLEPYYKDERTDESPIVQDKYCCKDSAVTLENSIEQDKLLNLLPPASRAHYIFNRQLLLPLLYMQLRGIKYDLPKRDFLLTILRKGQSKLQALVNRQCGVVINVRSHVKMKEYLYEVLQLPPQYKIEKRTKKLTSNEEALLELIATCGDRYPQLRAMLRLKQVSTRISSLEKPCDSDNRMRCSYNIVGTETQRLTCYASSTGNGDNLQTITEKNRVLYTADDNKWFFQIDLSGADGWTVAARCASLGDTTMLDDYLFGLKPAKILAVYALGFLKSNATPRDEIKQIIKDVEKSGKLNEKVYFACKGCQHGTNYGMNELTLMKTIFKQSEGKVRVSKSEAATYQRLYLSRYVGIPMWHRWVQQQLRDYGYLTSASGHRRIFFGRRDDKNTFKEAYSNEPQENTTYATNLAMHRLWYDRENRTAKGNLRIEPLHQVHDALNGQFRKSDVSWAIPKLREYFNNTIVIAGIPVRIPFEGYYGPSWGNKTNPI